MLGDKSRQWDCIQRGGHYQLLSAREPEARAHRYFRETIEILLEFRRRGELPLGERCGRSHGYDYYARDVALTINRARRSRSRSTSAPKRRTAQILLPCDRAIAIAPG